MGLSATEKLSQAVRKKQIAAADPAASAWVRANAGSGKTRVLVDRLLRLLLEGVPPAQILALTFTKAAAAEMKERLQTTMSVWAGCDDDTLTQALTDLTGTPPKARHLSRARALFAVALETPGGLKIQTIHGFCQAVLERFSVEAGVPANFSVIEDQDAFELKQQAQDQLLATTFAPDSAPDSEDLAQAVQITIDEAGEHGFAKLMNEALYQAGQFNDLFTRLGGPAGATKVLSDHLSLNPEDDPFIVPTLDQLDPGFDLTAVRSVIARMATDGGKRDKQRAEKWLPYCEEQSPENLKLFCTGFLTAAGAPLSEKSLISKTCDKDETGKPILLAAMAEALRLLDLQKSYGTRRRTAALLMIIDYILTSYAAAKAERGTLDYADLILKTRSLLENEGGAGWVLYKLDQGIDHILVDEAQDTSPDQWAIIEALSAEFFAGAGSRPDDTPISRTIFAVGDEKQSIYRFQGADPSGFARMADQFGSTLMALDQVWRDIELEVSFRSTPAVLRFVDSVFEDDTARRGLAAGDAAPAHIAYRQHAPGLVVRWPVIEPPEQKDIHPWQSPVDAPRPDSPLNMLATRIADELRHWFDTGRILAGQGRAVRPGDILILLRSRGAKLDALVRALKSRAIPVAGADRMILNDQIAIMDLMALGDWALCPDDDLGLATLLKGPFCGLTEAQLFDLAHGRKTTLWERLNEFADTTPGSIEAAARDWLSPLIGAAAHLRPFDFYALVLEQSEGRKRLVGRLGQQAVDPINEFFARTMNFERGRTASLQNFLHAMRQDRSELKRDMEKSDNAVRIMTVHGAKGLEAPIVIMPDLMSPPTKQKMPALLPLGAPDDLIPPVWRKNEQESDPVTRAAAADYLEAEHAEYRRLLYVGLTRAEDELYLCAYKGKQTSKENKWQDYVSRPAADHTEPFAFIDDDAERLINKDEGNPVTPDKPDAPKTATFGPAPLPNWALANARTERPDARPLAPSSLLPFEGDEDAPTANSPLVAPPAWEPEAPSPLKRGTLLHLLLEVLPDITPKSRRAAAKRILSQPAHDLPENIITTWIDEIMAVLENPDFAPLFAEGSMAEVPVTGLIGADVADRGGLALSGQIDRLAVTDDEVLIIDYKTNQPPPKRAADVASAYVGQMAAYRALLRKIYPGHQVRAALLFTDSCALIELSGGQLDQAAKKITGLPG